MIEHKNIAASDFRRLITRKRIQLAGNKKLKIYGNLRCGSGKRMKIENRIFFSSQDEAIQSGFRPCGKCMPAAFKNWKQHGTF